MLTILFNQRRMDKGKNKSMERFLKIFRKSNMSVGLYCFLNLIIIYLVILFFDGSTTRSVLYAILLYAISLVIALSPLGIKILCWRSKAAELTRQDEESRFSLIYKEVYRKAVILNPDIPSLENLHVYIRENDSVQSAGIGENVLFITSGLLRMPENQIMAVLGHELGHFSNGETYLTLLSTVGSLIIYVIIYAISIALFVALLILGIFWRLLCLVASIVSPEMAFFGGLGQLGGLITSAGGLFKKVGSLLASGWSKLGNFIMHHSNLENDYEADEFAVNLGYGRDLCKTIDENRGGAEGFFKQTISSDADAEARIGNMQNNLGVDYKNLKVV